MTDWTTARVTPETLTELRRLLDAATPGPWRTEYLMGAGNDLLTAIVAGRATPDDLRVIGSTLAERDGKFIVAAVNALPALLDAAAERDTLAAAWDEGHQAGHEDARAVQSTYPEPTPNPYRAEGDPR